MNASLQDVAPDDYTKANKEGFADKIDDIRTHLSSTHSSRSSRSSRSSQAVHRQGNTFAQQLSVLARVAWVAWVASACNVLAINDSGDMVNHWQCF
jgi:hypothetical protein